MILRLLARETDVAELAVIELGKRPQGLPPVSPSFEYRVNCQQAIDCQQDDVIVP
jgi:hypothetical protein